MTRRLPLLLLLVAAANAARANATWRPEAPLALWRDAPVAESGANARTNALGAAFCADTGLVPAPGPFTASALLRVVGEGSGGPRHGTLHAHERAAPARRRGGACAGLVALRLGGRDAPRLRGTRMRCGALPALPVARRA